MGRLRIVGHVEDGDIVVTELYEVVDVVTGDVLGTVSTRHSLGMMLWLAYRLNLVVSVSKRYVVETPPGLGRDVGL